MTSFDAKVSLNYRLSKDSVVTAAVEGFNLFNSQRPTLVDQNYTLGFVGPILGASQGSVPTQFGGICATSSASSCQPGNGSLPRPRVDPATGGAIRVGLPNPSQALSSQVTNVTWGSPTNYQPVRQFRFSLRLTF